MDDDKDIFGRKKRLVKRWKCIRAGGAEGGYAYEKGYDLLPGRLEWKRSFW